MLYSGTRTWWLLLAQLRCLGFCFDWNTLAVEETHLIFMSPYGSQDAF